MLDFPVLLITQRPEAKFISVSFSQISTATSPLCEQISCLFGAPYNDIFVSLSLDEIYPVSLETSWSLTIQQSVIAHSEDILLAMANGPITYIWVCSQRSPNFWFQSFRLPLLFSAILIVSIFLRDLQYSILPCIPVNCLQGYLVHFFFFKILEETKSYLLSSTVF